MNNEMWRFEQKFRKYAISNLMTYIVAAMGVTFVLNMLFGVSRLLYFDRAAIFSGQIWRVVTFLILPPSSSLIFIVLSLYFYWMIGTALEREWGAFKFNLFYFTGALGSIIAGLITGFSTNEYLNMSLFFAFAILYPDFQVLVFFLIPIKMKYLAYLDAALFLVLFITGSFSSKVALVFSLINIVLFFGGDLINRIKQAYRHYKWKSAFRK